jgi:hypothetical protein
MDPSPVINGNMEWLLPALSWHTCIDGSHGKEFSLAGQAKCAGGICILS